MQKDQNHEGGEFTGSCGSPAEVMVRGVGNARNNLDLPNSTSSILNSTVEGVFAGSRQK